MLDLPSPIRRCCPSRSTSFCRRTTTSVPAMANLEGRPNPRELRTISFNPFLHPLNILDLDSFEELKVLPARKSCFSLYEKIVEGIRV
ncbi:hypothetical protein LOK49_LG15G02226 [Camellia lanceoleosa]|uniref:Uncharacterized protein n=1 Tax=Camellia lanceoleosa TaxID=1840588 RepID=A0ACC0F5M2_9ERIC|nr:hypothetical protein LOK49_LG15G02226 [Camellia lanceoleosa]